MTTPRLGYACINTYIQEDPTLIKRLRPCVNRSCMAETFRKKGVEYVVDLVCGNLQTVLKVLEWNEENGIRGGKKYAQA